MKWIKLFIIFISVSMAWDYFIFVQVWPESWTNISNNSYFTIHGLWMENLNGSYPEYCSGSPFNVSELNPIKDQLTTFWTDFKNATEFWKHEYNKHFKCAQDTFPNVYKLFYYGLMLRNKYNLYELLKNNGIYPSNTVFYDINKINYVFNTSVVITCETENILTEIWMCMDKQFRPFGCPKNLSASGCKFSKLWYKKFGNNNVYF